MVADRTKKLKVSEKGENLDEIDGELVLSIEKLQEIQDELEKVLILQYSHSLSFFLFFLFFQYRGLRIFPRLFFEVFM